MTVNTIQISARTHPYDSRVDANGSYTLPQYAFIPHPSLQAVSGTFIPGPVPAIVSAAFTAPSALAGRAMPASTGPAFVTRTISYKTSPKA